MSLDFAEENGQHFHGGQYASRVVVLYRTAILLIGDIATIMILGLDTPVSTESLKQVFCVVLTIAKGRRTGNSVAKLFRCFECLTGRNHFAFDSEYLRSGI